MLIRTLVVCSVLFMSQPVEAQSWQFNTVLGMTVVMHGADVAQTKYILDHGGKELNPLAPSPSAAVFVQGGLAIVSTWGKQKLYKQKPKLAWLVSVGELAVMSFIVYHNFRVVGELS